MTDAGCQTTRSFLPHPLPDPGLTLISDADL
jgi:hypothetical protein